MTERDTAEQDNRPPAAEPRSAALAAIAAATQNLAEMQDRMRDMTTRSIALAAQIQQKVDELKNMEQR